MRSEQEGRYEEPVAVTKRVYEGARGRTSSGGEVVKEPALGENLLPDSAPAGVDHK